MSLDYFLGDIEDYKTLCFNEDGMNHETKGLIFATIGLGIDRITEKNWREFAIRLRIWEQVVGCFCYHDGHYFLPPQVVRQHIGLSTNASKKTRAQFFDHLASVVERRIESENEKEVPLRIKKERPA